MAWMAEEIDAHTVERLRGKEYKGSVEDIDHEIVYPDLSQ
jgi:hypothetical protein